MWAHGLSTSIKKSSLSIVRMKTTERNNCSQWVCKKAENCSSIFLSILSNVWMKYIIIGGNDPLGTFSSILLVVCRCFWALGRKNRRSIGLKVGYWKKDLGFQAESNMLLCPFELSQIAFMGCLCYWKLFFILACRSYFLVLLAVREYRCFLWQWCCVEMGRWRRGEIAYAGIEIGFLRLVFWTLRFDIVTFDVVQGYGLHTFFPHTAGIVGKEDLVGKIGHFAFAPMLRSFVLKMCAFVPMLDIDIVQTSAQGYGCIELEEVGAYCYTEQLRYFQYIGCHLDAVEFLVDLELISLGFYFHLKYCTRYYWSPLQNFLSQCSFGSCQSRYCLSS